MKCYYITQLSGEESDVLALDVTERGALRELCCPPKAHLAFLEQDPNSISVTRRWEHDATAYTYIKHELSEQVAELEELYEGPALLLSEDDRVFGDRIDTGGCFIESSRRWTNADVSWSYNGEKATADIDHITTGKDVKPMPFRVSILADFGFSGWSYLGGRRNYGKPDNQTGFRLCRRTGGPARS